ncbi:MAG: hypothetical protein WAL10_23225, partial [Acetobacteraceae bacterium]
TDQRLVDLDYRVAKPLWEPQPIKESALGTLCIHNQNVRIRLFKKPLKTACGQESPHRISAG